MQRLFVRCIMLLYIPLTTYSLDTLTSTSKKACLYSSLKDFRACSSVLEKWSRGNAESPVVIAHGYLVHNRKRVDSHGPLKIDEVMSCFENVNQRYMSCINL